MKVKRIVNLGAFWTLLVHFRMLIRLPCLSTSGPNRAILGHPTNSISLCWSNMESLYHLCLTSVLVHYYHKQSSEYIPSDFSEVVLLQNYISENKTYLYLYVSKIPVPSILGRTARADGQTNLFSTTHVYYHTILSLGHL